MQLYHIAMATTFSKQAILLILYHVCGPCISRSPLEKGACNSEYRNSNMADPSLKIVTYRIRMSQSRSQTSGHEDILCLCFNYY